MMKALVAITVALGCATNALAVIPASNPATNGGFTIGNTDLGSGPDIRTFSTISFNFAALQPIRLQFSMAGNPNGDGAEDFAAGFVFARPASLSLFDPGGALGNVAAEADLTVTSHFVKGRISDSAAAAIYVIDFVANQAGSARGRVQTGSSGGIGPAISNLQIGIYRSVEALPPPPPPPPLIDPLPEPGSWALLIVGFGLTGGVLRRRRQSHALPA